MGKGSSGEARGKVQQKWQAGAQGGSEKGWFLQRNIQKRARGPHMVKDEGEGTERVLREGKVCWQPVPYVEGVEHRGPGPGLQEAAACSPIAQGSRKDPAPAKAKGGVGS